MHPTSFYLPSGLWIIVLQFWEELWNYFENLVGYAILYKPSGTLCIRSEEEIGRYKTETTVEMPVRTIPFNLSVAISVSSTSSHQIGQKLRQRKIKINTTVCLMTLLSPEIVKFSNAGKKQFRKSDSHILNVTSATFCSTKLLLSESWSYQCYETLTNLDKCHKIHLRWLFLSFIQDHL